MLIITSHLIRFDWLQLQLDALRVSVLSGNYETVIGAADDPMQINKHRA